MKAKERYGQTTFSCSNISGSCNPGLASFRFVIHQWVIFQHSMSIGVYANTVKFLLTATSLQWPLQLFLISADSPYIHRYLTLSTVTTSPQRQQPLKRRLRVGPLSLSPSCVTGKKTMWKKMAVGHPRGKMHAKGGNQDKHSCKTSHVSWILTTCCQYSWHEPIIFSWCESNAY